MKTVVDCLSQVRLFIIFLMILSCTQLVPKSTHQGHFADLAEGEKKIDHHNVYQHFVAASGGRESSLIAAQIYQKSENIVDSAVALSFALAVERPHSTGICGGGFLLLKLVDQKIPLVFDFRETAPLASSETMFQDKDGNVIERLSLDGVKSVAVPGLVAGLYDIHQKYGSLDFAELLAPAIRLAEKGFVIYPSLAEAIDKRKPVMAGHDFKNIFYHKDGSARQVGEILKQPQLAKTLRLIAEKGKDGFYKQEVAQAIVDKVKAFGGILTLKDLESYQVKQRSPIHTRYKGKNIFSMPPPSSGGLSLAQILNILAEDNLSRLGFQSAQSLHLMASAMQLAYLDRARYLGDSDFVTVPSGQLSSAAYGQKLRDQIKDKAIASKVLAQNSKIDLNFSESDETTNFSLMDHKGNALVSTQTINWLFGSGVIVSDYGLILNNEMDDFTAKVGEKNVFQLVGGAQNSIAPAKRPLSSMTPTIVTNENHRPLMAIGSPAGSRIITCVAQAIINYLDYQLPLYESIAATRIHHQWMPDQILVDESGLNDEVLQKLSDKGHQITQGKVGCRVSAVAQEGALLQGVADPRDYGQVQGLSL